MHCERGLTLSLTLSLILTLILTLSLTGSPNPNPNPNPNPDQVHCVASEPSYTVLRISVWERGQEVAFETCVLGALRRGYRCLEMRSRLGTINSLYDLSTLMCRYDIRIYVVDRCIAPRSSCAPC